MGPFCTYFSNDFLNPFLFLVSVVCPGVSFTIELGIVCKSFRHKGREKVILNFISCWHHSEIKSLNLCKEVQVIPGQRPRVPKGFMKELLGSPGPSVCIRCQLSLKIP